MVECGGLENRFARVPGNEGSNPSSSAIQILRSGERSIELTLKSPLIPHLAPSLRACVQSTRRPRRGAI